MAILGGNPISAVPISGLDGAAPVLDSFIPTQMTAFDAQASYGDPDTEEGFDYQGTQAAPLDDNTGDTTDRVATQWFVDPDWDDETDNWSPDWAQAPPGIPINQDDEYVPSPQPDVWDDDEPPTDGWLSSPLEDLPPVDTTVPPQETGQVWDDDEPVTDGLTAGAPDQDDEYVSNEFADVWDDDEPYVEGWAQSPLDDAPPDTTVPPQELGQVWDDDEPVTDGSTQPPPDQDDEYVRPPQPDVWDDDEPVTDGFIAGPLDDAPVIVVDISNTSFADVWDDDEPVTEGFTDGPLQDSPVAPPNVPPLPEPAGGGRGTGDPGFGSRTIRGEKQIDDRKRMWRLHVKRERKRREQERRKRLLMALIHSLGLLDEEE